jgi:hypothetical protein
LLAVFADIAVLLRHSFYNFLLCKLWGMDARAQKWNETSPIRPQRGSKPNPATVLTSIGVCSIVFGGLIAAVTGPLGLVHGSWLAAYLVLVGGVTQCAMGLARSRRPGVIQPRRSWAQIGCWNLGSVVVIGATLAGEPVAVDLGSALLVIALVIAFGAERPGDGRAARPVAGGAARLVDLAYRSLLLVLAVSVPVGVAMSYVRHS